MGALATFTGAVVLVSHDDGAVTAPNPERVLFLPDGDENHWNAVMRNLFSCASNQNTHLSKVFERFSLLSEES